MKTAEQFFEAEKEKDTGDYDHLGKIPYIFRHKIIKMMDEYAMEVVKNFNSLPNGSNLFVMGSCPHEFIAPTTLTTPYPQRRCWKCGQLEGNLS